MHIISGDSTRLCNLYIKNKRLSDQCRYQNEVFQTKLSMVAVHVLDYRVQGKFKSLNLSIIMSLELKSD